MSLCLLIQRKRDFNLLYYIYFKTIVKLLQADPADRGNKLNNFPHNNIQR